MSSLFSSMLILDQQIHTEGKPYECTNCEKAFSQYAHLTQHLRVYTGDKPYVCHECGKHSARYQNLPNIREVTLESSPIKEAIVLKVFSNNSHLTVHMGTHFEEEPYKCNECENPFV